jgi:hypothetical protein
MHYQLLFFVQLFVFVQYTGGQASPGYCTRAAGIFNVADGAACINSAAYNVTNCCFTCYLASNNTANCGSLYNYNVAGCNQDPAATAQAQADCGGSNYQCYCTAGTDYSEVSATSLPTALRPSGNVPTPMPTSGANGNNSRVFDGSFQDWCTVIGVLTIAAVMIRDLERW